MESRPGGSPSSSAPFLNELTDDALVTALRSAGLPETARVPNRTLRLPGDRRASAPGISGS